MAIVLKARAKINGVWRLAGESVVTNDYAAERAMVAAGTAVWDGANPFNVMAAGGKLDPGGTALPGQMTMESEAQHATEHALMAAAGTLLSPYLLAQTAVPGILAPTSTWSDTVGNLTLGTALPFNPTSIGVVRIYLFASGIGSAGLYYARFSSTTVCQVFTDAAGTVPITSVAGAYTPTVATAAPLATVTVPGGMMGTNGAIRAIALFTSVNNANVKTPGISFGGLDMYAAGLGSWAQLRTFGEVRNRGNAAINVATSNMSSGWGNAAGTTNYGSVNTVIDQTLTFSSKIATATDYVILEGYTAEVLSR